MQSILLALLAAVAASPEAPVDAAAPIDPDGATWPQWRGPARDGRAAGFRLPARWPEELVELWRVEVGEGHSTPVVAAGRAFVLARQGENEVVLALDLASGKELWRSSYPAPYEPDPAAASHGKGPKSTPVAHAGSLFTFGINGVLTALGLEKGELRWRREFSKEFPRTSPLFGTALSPLIEGDLLIAHVGGHDRGALRAFDLKTGEPRWSFDGDGPSYVSPIALDLAGERQVVSQTQVRFLGVSARSGKLLWSIPFKTAYLQNIVTPQPYRGFLIYSGYQEPTAAIELKREGEELVPKEVWRAPDVPMFMSSPVLAGDLLFGMANKQRGLVFCLDPGSGEVLWKSGGGLGENVAMVNLGGALALLTSGGELIFIRASREGFEPLARYRVAKSPTWAHPVILGRRILVKDKTHLAALELRAPN